MIFRKNFSLSHISQMNRHFVCNFRKSIFLLIFHLFFDSTLFLIRTKNSFFQHFCISLQRVALTYVSKFTKHFLTHVRNRTKIEFFVRNKKTTLIESTIVTSPEKRDPDYGMTSTYKKRTDRNECHMIKMLTVLTR